MKGPAASLAVLVAAAAAAAPAHAYLKAGPAGYGHWLKATAVQDGMATSLSAAYSFRLVRSAYLGTGAAVRLRRASDNAESDIGFSGSNDFDAVSATAFCAATTCFIKAWYDQSANARHVTQATAAAQPQYIADCNGSLPCMRVTADGQELATAGSFSSVAGNGTFSAVAKRQAVGAGYCVFAAGYGAASPNIFAAAGGTANQWILGGTGHLAATVADGSFHAGIGVMNGASSVISIDGTETTGLAIGTTGSGNFRAPLGATTVTCDISEVLHWNNYAMPASERTPLAANMKAYWGTP